MGLVRNNGLKIVFVLGLAFLVCFQIVGFQSAYADVEEVETEHLQISKTEPGDSKDSSDGGGGDIPWYEKVFNEIKEFGENLIDDIQEFGETLAEGWGNFKEWVADSWIADTWEWIKDNEWIQTIAAGITATIAIVGGIVVVVGTFPAWGTVAIIGGLAIGGGFVYQWIAGDDYSFWGALGSSLIGGLLGYAGVATGAFAWLRHTGGPMAWNWLKGTAFPWVLRQGKGAWNWMKGTAFPWIVRQGKGAWNWLKGTAMPWLLKTGRAGLDWMKGKGLAALDWATKTAWPWLKGKGVSLWSKLSGPYLVPNVLNIMLKGAAVGTAGGIASNFLLVLAGEDTFSLKKLAVDALLGGLTGGLLAPILVPGVALSGTLLTGIGIWGGIDNWLSGGLKEGEWTLENFVVGGLVAAGSTKLLAPLIDKFIPDKISGDGLTKAFEVKIKNHIGDELNALRGNGETAGNHSGKEIELNTKEVPEWDVTPDPESKVPEPNVTPDPESKVPEPNVTPDPEIKVPEPNVTPDPEIEVPEPDATSDPDIEVEAPEPGETPEAEVEAPEPGETPEAEVEAPGSEETPEAEVEAPESEETPEAEVEAPEPGETSDAEEEVTEPEETPEAESTPEQDIEVSELEGSSATNEEIERNTEPGVVETHPKTSGTAAIKPIIN